LSVAYRLNCDSVPPEMAEADLWYQPTNDQKFDTFESYVAYHNKTYVVPYRLERRKQAFAENLDIIRQHNDEFDSGKSSFKLRTNVMADLSSDQYLWRNVRLIPDERRRINTRSIDQLSHLSTPDSVDWRERGFVTDIVNQKTCGSCYAFSIGYAISAQIFKRINRVELLSEQQMVDCSVEVGNHGCTGGSLRNTLKYLKSCGGIMRAKDYPYTSSVRFSFFG
jgi:cathepsin L